MKTFERKLLASVRSLISSLSNHSEAWLYLSHAKTCHVLLKRDELRHSQMAIFVEECSISVFQLDTLVLLFLGKHPLENVRNNNTGLSNERNYSGLQYRTRF